MKEQRIIEDAEEKEDGEHQLVVVLMMIMIMTMRPSIDSWMGMVAQLLRNRRAVKRRAAPFVPL